MKQISIIGAACENLPEEVCQLAKSVGKELARGGFIVMTGSSKGVGINAVKGAKSVGGMTVGISPAANEQDLNNYDTSNEFLDVVIYTGSGYKGRNVTLIRSADAVVSIHGGFGTLNEITIAHGEQKPIVVLDGSGGASDLAREIFNKLSPTYPLFAIARTPEEVIERLTEFFT